MKGVKFAGIGIALPNRVVTNNDIVNILLAQRQKAIVELAKSKIILTKEQIKEYETSDEWIVPRTGIHERRFAEESETTSDYAAMAGHKTWTDAYGDGLEIPDFLLLGTVSPDHFTTPSTSAITHRKMGIPVYLQIGGEKRLRRFIARDITQACSSFVAALEDGCSLIRSGECQRGLVIGADLMTRVMSWNRRSPFIILADAGGGIALEEVPEEESWIGPKAFFAGVNGGKDGEYEDLIKNRAGGAAMPTKPEHLDPRVDEHKMLMIGNPVFTTLVPMVANEIIPAALDQAGLTLSDIDVLILHQANIRIVNAVVERLLNANADVIITMATRANPEGEFLKNRKPEGNEHVVVCYNNIDHFGNTTSASVPLSLHEARELGIIRPGKRVVVVVYGGGLGWFSVIVEWGGRHLPAFQRVNK